jgi:hypothetical protein
MRKPKKKESKTSGAEESPGRPEFLKKTRENIKKYGHGVISVMASETEPGFSYTVGRIEQGLPELIIFGVPTQTGANALNDAVDWAQRFKGIFPEHTPIEGIINFPATFKPVQETYLSIYFKVVFSLYPVETFPALQMIWTDVHNKFPWEPGFDASLSKCQPILYAQA